MPVKSDLQPILDAINAVQPPVADLTPETLRTAYAALSGTTKVEEVAAVEDRTITGPGGDLPLRTYRPRVSANRSGSRAGALVWFHGGGWVIGDLDTHDNICRSLANAAGIVVISVDYRLAPEHPFPAALDDAWTAVRWVAENAIELGIDPERLAVGGDSAGGNLAALVSQGASQRGPSLRFQLLIYPLLDARYQTASMDENAEGYFLTKEILLWFRDHYLHGAGSTPGREVPDLADTRVSPACTPDSDLEGLPPGLLIAAELDPLRDEGEAYGERCRAVGVDMTVSCYEGMIHGFFSMAELVADGRVAIDQAADHLKRHLA